MAYAVTDGKKVYRITFSRSLAELISKQTGYHVRPCELHLGKELKPNEKSENNLYAICKRKNGWPLRVTFFKEAANMWFNDSTSINECKIQLL